MIDKTVPSGTPETFDALVAGLQALRIEAGVVTYDELAARITRDRLSRGLAPAAARVARSTVYDSFRSGRRRINAELVAEIASALGGDEAAVDEWRQRCLRATLNQSSNRVHSESLREEPRLPTARVLVGAVMLASLGLNLFGNATSARVGAPLFLDMIGTAIASIVFGPWYGATVGISTNVLASLSNSPQALPFAAVNIVGALVWGYGVRSWGLGRTPLRFLTLNAIVAVACTLTAAPIIALLFGGSTVNDAAGGLLSMLRAQGATVGEALLASNITVSLADKQIAGFIAVGVALALARRSAPVFTSASPPLLWAQRRATG